MKSMFQDIIRRRVPGVRGRLSCVDEVSRSCQLEEGLVDETDGGLDDDGE